MSSVQSAIPEPKVKSSFRDLSPVGGGPRIRLDRAALSELELLIREGVRSLNGRGLEIGGLILGASIDWSAADVVITGFLPVEIEYRSGPSFRPSEADATLFKEAAAKADARFIGYFRSQLRDGFPVREEDSRLLGQLFPKSDCCFISIHASANTPSNVDLYQVKQGTAPELLQLFALKEREQPPATAEKPPAPPSRPLQEAAKPPVAPTPAAAAAAPPTVAASAGAATTDPATTEAQPQRSSLLWTIGGLVAALSIATIAFTVGRRSGEAPQPVRPQAAKPLTNMAGDPKIGLHILERGPQIEVRWNSSDAAIATAARGMLIITDAPGASGLGPASRSPGDIDLDANQLRSGLYLYKPVRNTLTVLLMIYQPDGSFTGDLKEFTGTHPGPEPPILAPPLSLSALPPPEQLAPPPISRTDRPSSAGVTPPPSETPPDQPKVVAEPIPAKQPRSWSAPQPVASTKVTPLPTLLEPPPPTPGGAAVSAPKLPMMAVPPPPVPVSPVPNPGPNLTYHAGPTQFIAPQVSHQAIPAVPLGIASKIRTEVQLEVMVAVDADGRVTAARVVSSRGPAAGLLTIETLKAAQLCRFTPAQQDGHPVSSSTVLTFRFTPKPNY